MPDFLSESSPAYSETALIPSFDEASIHPFIGAMCVAFMDNVIPMMERNGQKKRAHKDIAARTYFQGIFESLMYSFDNKIARKAADVIDETHITGAVSLFVGGTMVRGGFYKSVETYANVWRKKNEKI